MVSGLLKRTELYIQENKLLDLAAGFHVVAGVSGGADSVCLLLLLYELMKNSSGSLKAVHINHNLRAEAADADQKFVEELCAARNIPLAVFSEDVAGYAQACGMSLEEAGREIRYRRFAETAKEWGAKIAVAHHLDDNAETILFRLIRGSDLKGLAGMKPETMINGCPVIRPLLFASRDEIEEYLRECGQAFCKDLTNEDTGYSRNKIRQCILPVMKEINPKAAEHICRTAETIKAAEKMIEEQTEAAFESAAKCGYISPDQEASCPEWIELDAAFLEKTSAPVTDGVFYKAITRLSGSAKDISRTHVEDAEKLLGTGSGKRIVLPGNITAVRENRKIVLQKNKPVHGAFETVRIPKDLGGKPFMEVDLPDGRKLRLEMIEIEGSEEKRNALIQKNLYTKALDYDKIKGGLFAGPRQNGDLITLSYGTKHVNRYMIDHKIPADCRDKILILRDEEEVLWIAGFRISESYKITETTTRALRVTLYGDNFSALEDGDLI